MGNVNDFGGGFDTLLNGETLARKVEFFELGFGSLATLAGCSPIIALKIVSSEP